MDLGIIFVFVLVVIAYTDSGYVDSPFMNDTFDCSGNDFEAYYGDYDDEDDW